VVTAIQAIGDGDDRDSSHSKRLGCLVENKDKKQVAFRWFGIINNWRGICHDPTGTVLKANILERDWSNRDDTEYGKARFMFGGEMVRATRLWGNWHWSAFT
jgi:hypothetical protein